MHWHPGRLPRSRWLRCPGFTTVACTYARVLVLLVRWWIHRGSCFPYFSNVPTVLTVRSPVLCSGIGRP